MRNHACPICHNAPNEKCLLLGQTDFEYFPNSHTSVDSIVCSNCGPFLVTPGGKSDLLTHGIAVAEEKRLNASKKMKDSPMRFMIVDKSNTWGKSTGNFKIVNVEELFTDEGSEVHVTGDK